MRTLSLEELLDNVGQMEESFWVACPKDQKISCGTIFLLIGPQEKETTSLPKPYTYVFEIRTLLRVLRNIWHQLGRSCSSSYLLYGINFYKETRKLYKIRDWSFLKIT